MLDEMMDVVMMMGEVMVGEVVAVEVIIRRRGYSCLLVYTTFKCRTLTLPLDCVCFT